MTWQRRKLGRSLSALTPVVEKNNKLNKPENYQAKPKVYQSSKVEK